MPHLLPRVAEGQAAPVHRSHSSFVALPAALVLLGAAEAGRILMVAAPVPDKDPIAVSSLQQELTTESYKREALQVLLKEANEAVRRMQLPEALPIKLSDLIDFRIETPFWSDHD